MKPIVVYTVLAYFISWLTFIVLALNHQLDFLFPDDEAHARLQDAWHSLGALGPMIAAVITLRLFYNRETRKTFLSGYSIKKLRAIDWLLSFSPLLIFAFSQLVNFIIRHEWVDVSGFFKTNKLTNPVNLFAWSLPILFYGFGEESGWRGFALPALQAKHSAFQATFIVFIVWAGWHIPSFFYRYDLKGAAYLFFLLGLFSGAIWLSFLFNYTGGSTLAVSVWHLTFNLVSMIAKDEMVLSAVMSTVVMLSAAFVVLKYKLENLSPFYKAILQK